MAYHPSPGLAGRIGPFLRSWTLLRPGTTGGPLIAEGQAALTVWSGTKTLVVSLVRQVTASDVPYAFGIVRA